MLIDLSICSGQTDGEVFFREIEMLVLVKKVMIGITTSSLKHICSADINRPVMSKHIYKGPPLQTANLGSGWYSSMR